MRHALHADAVASEKPLNNRVAECGSDPFATVTSTDASNCGVGRSGDSLTDAGLGLGKEFRISPFVANDFKAWKLSTA